MTHTFKSREQFLASFSMRSVFCATRQRPEKGTRVTIAVHVGRRRPPAFLSGTVDWVRRGVHTQSIRAGYSVLIDACELPTLDWLTSEPFEAHRMHARGSVASPVTWRYPGGREWMASFIDVSETGALIDALLIPVEPEVVVRTAHGEIAARVVRTVPHGTGFAVMWLARDHGGERRVREIVRRLVEVRP